MTNVVLSGAATAGQITDLASEIDATISDDAALGQSGVMLSSSTYTLAGQPQWVFDIPQVVNLTYLANTVYTGRLVRNDPVNRTDFKLVRGVQNTVFFFIRDSARNPVQANNALTINLTMPETLLMRRAIAGYDINKGIYLLTLAPADIEQLPIGTIRWSVSYVRDDQSTVLLWTEHNTPYSVASVLEGPIPESITATIPWADFSPLTGPPVINVVTMAPLYFSSPLIGAAQRPYSNGLQSFIISMTAFVGNVRIDGSLASQPDDSASSGDWFQIDSIDYTTFTGDDAVTELGCFIWVRIVVTLISGSLDQVQYTA